MSRAAGWAPADLRRHGGVWLSFCIHSARCRKLHDTGRHWTSPDGLMGRQTTSSEALLDTGRYEMTQLDIVEI